jgi:hypothetical protein
VCLADGDELAQRVGANRTPARTSTTRRIDDPVTEVLVAARSTTSEPGY